MSGRAVDLIERRIKSLVAEIRRELDHLAEVSGTPKTYEMREIIAEQRETIRQLKALLAPRARWDFEFKPTATEHVVLHWLMRHGFGAYPLLLDLIDRTHPSKEKSTTGESLKVAVCHLRPKLRKEKPPIIIRTKFKDGYYVDPVNQALLKSRYVLDELETI